MRAVHLVAVGALLGGCLEEPERPSSAGVVSGDAANVTHTIVIGWALDCAPSFQVDGAVEVVDDAFSLDDVLSLSPTPPQPPCRRRDQEEECVENAPDGSFGLGWLFGSSAELADVPASVQFGSLETQTTGAADSVVAVYTPREITRSMDEWAHFETELPAGLSIMRMVPCNVWDERFECWLDFGPRFCLEPLGEGALVTVRGW